MSEPLVSVRFMVYNNEPYIREAIESILMQQTNFKVEIVVGDDFSTDNTLDIIKSYCDTENIHINILDRPIGGDYWKVRQKLGRLYNFKNIVDNCQGKYIALCDGDDYWTDPLKLQKQVDFLEGNLEYNICFHSVKLFDEDSRTFVKDSITRKVDLTTTVVNLAKGNYMHTPSVVLRNNFRIPQWFNKVTIGDWALYMIAIKEGKIKKIEEEMAVYRLHNASIWSNKSIEIRKKHTQETVRLIYRNLKKNLSSSAIQILQSRLGISKFNSKIFLKKVYRKLFK
ncbi:glycosyltransferase [Winogradskyella vidalii]|uniref:glycosyltransferase n=1 Tax=Winogradskyella vidalii TaxID=2615024 RepID=UPI0015C7F3D4|nr:glycosyltransferase [Winogradskyella vidalii]